MRRNTLTNMIMSNKRKDTVYQTLVTDLVLLGTLTKEEGEALLGYKIPAHLRLPKEAERFLNVLKSDEEDLEDDTVTDDDKVDELGVTVTNDDKVDELGVTVTDDK